MAIKSKSEGQFKEIVRAKAREYEFSCLMKMKSKHESKMGLLNYSKLCMQDYLKLENFDKKMAQTVFRYRVRMANYGKKFQGTICGLHLDSQAICFDNCPNLRDNIQIRGTYSDVHKQKIQVELANSLVQIDKVREGYMSS